MKLPYEFVETEPHEKGFADFYKKAIVPLAEKHNDEFNRRWYVNLFNKSLAVTSEIVLTLVTIKYLFFANSLPKAMAALGANVYFPPFISWWLLVHRTNKEYFSAIKKDVIPKILQFKGEFKYLSNTHVNLHLLKSHNIFSIGRSYTAKCDDVIEYQDGKIFLTILEKIKWSVKHSGYIYFIFEYPDNFPGEAIICSNTSNAKHKSRINHFLNIRQKTNFNTHLALAEKNNHSRLYQKKSSSFKALKQRAFTSEKFNEYFEIFTNNDEIEALFCEEFVDYLVYIRNLFVDDGLILSIKGSSLIIEIPSKMNMFEITNNYDTPVLNALEIKWLLKELHLAIETVDMINFLIKRNTENIKHAAE